MLYFTFVYLRAGMSCEIIILQKEWDEGPFLFERIMQQVGFIDYGLEKSLDLIKISE